MNKKNVIFFLILTLVFLSSCASKNPSVLIDHDNKKIKVNVEIADDKTEQEKGLMFRNSLDKSSGMLFVFDHENQYAFWMKNTLIPLDMMFINKNMEIIDIKNAMPCKADPCPLYDPSHLVLYVLEVNGGFAAKYNISVGDKIEILNYQK